MQLSCHISVASPRVPCDIVLFVRFLVIFGLSPALPLGRPRLILGGLVILRSAENCVFFVVVAFVLYLRSCKEKKIRISGSFPLPREIVLCAGVLGRTVGLGDFLGASGADNMGSEVIYCVYPYHRDICECNIFVIFLV